MTGFTERSRHTRFTGIVIGVDQVEYQTPAGGSMVREVVTHMGAVVVVPVDGDEVLLIRQFRAATGEDLLELPAGKRDISDESPEVTAIRECVEEVGFFPRRVDELHRFWNSPGFCDEYSHLFLARDLEPRETSPQGPEEQESEIVRMPIDDAMAMVAAGEIEDAKTLIGLYALEAWRREGRL